MALILLVAGILDKYAQIQGPNQRSYGAGVAAMTFLYTAVFGATWLTTPVSKYRHRIANRSDR